MYRGGSLPSPRSPSLPPPSPLYTHTAHAHRLLADLGEYTQRVQREADEQAAPKAPTPPPVAAAPAALTHPAAPVFTAPPIPSSAPAQPVTLSPRRTARLSTLAPVPNPARILVAAPNPAPAPATAAPVPQAPGISAALVQLTTTHILALERLVRMTVPALGADTGRRVLERPARS
ncbi:hypothetical protein BJ912DRAFT_978160 [Pholiota molesta]|nr:hypothetical protein BJ912DRAFT_978160 [Pholiota molesta]